MALRLHLVMSSILLATTASTAHGQLEPSCVKDSPRATRGNWLQSGRNQTITGSAQGTVVFGTLIGFLPATKREQRLIPRVLPLKRMVAGG